MFESFMRFFRAEEDKTETEKKALEQRVATEAEGVVKAKELDTVLSKLRKISPKLSYLLAFTVAPFILGKPYEFSSVDQETIATAARLLDANDQGNAQEIADGELANRQQEAETQQTPLEAETHFPAERMREYARDYKTYDVKTLDAYTQTVIKNIRSLLETRTEQMGDQSVPLDDLVQHIDILGIAGSSMEGQAQKNTELSKADLIHFLKSMEAEKNGLRKSLVFLLKSFLFQVKLFQEVND